MTRFARAKGSKASNEKAPEDATPWEVMKEQMLQAKKDNEDSKKRQEAEQQRVENYENFLKDRRVQKKLATWCDFPEMEQNAGNRSKIVAHQDQNVKKNKVTSLKNKKGNATTDIEVNSEVSTGTVVLKKKKKKMPTETQTTFDDNSGTNVTGSQILKKKNKKRKYEQNIVTSTNIPEQSKNKVTENSGPSKKKKKKQKGQAIENQAQSKDCSQIESKSQKNKKDKTAQGAAGDSFTTNEDANRPNDFAHTTEKSSEKQNKKQKKNKTKPHSSQGVSEKFDTQSNTNIANKQNKAKAKKKKKQLVNGQPVRRKEINDNSFQLIINGKEVELVRFDGFPVMKKDAERLADLKDSMLKKGIPKSEVQRTMKLERRRAEKALARLRRDVCYNCRKGGHNLSDCPELKSKIPGVDAPEGVCFKCGSTEHRQFECKVQRDKEFRFATCFICKEPGHIARQCPDNPKGLYPNGGSCKLCGDVTHLRKDCPTANTKKEETSVKLQTLDATDNIEDIGVQSKPTASSDSTKKPKKIRF